MSEPSDLWVCPKCGAKFVTANLWHSCGSFSLSDLFAKSEPRVFEIYQAFDQMAVAICGALTVIAQKTRVSYQLRTRFMGCTPRKSSLLIGFIFPRRVEHPRFRKITAYYPAAIGHEAQVASADEIDADFEDWIHEAYAFELTKAKK